MSFQMLSLLVRRLRNSWQNSRVPLCPRPGRLTRKPKLEYLEDRRVLSTVSNGVSQFPITVDGLFTDGPGIGEWSDVTPAAFHSPTFSGDAFMATQISDPQTNSLLFAALALEHDGSLSDELYLMYDYVPRTNPQFAPGEPIADISFPINQEGTRQVITVQFRGAQPGASSFFDVFVDLNGDSTPDLHADALGIEGAAAFGPSELSTNPHLLVELEVPLRIPASFGGIFPPSGVNPATGLYDPDPQFWTGDFAGERDPQKPPNDPPGSAGLFQINPDGSTSVDSSNLVSDIVNVSSKHPVNLKSNGLVPIVLHSTAGFDATTIDLSTVKFNGVSVDFKAVFKDADGDGLVDLVLEYHTKDLVDSGALTAGSPLAVITGLTAGGSVFGGSLLLDIVPA